MKKNNITAVVLTKNEEKNIKACLNALRWVDDLIVVDSGSTDNTVKIAKEIGARVFVNKPEQFYISEQRNWALDNSDIETEWVIFVDADEIITPKLKQDIIKYTCEASDDIAGFMLCFKFIFMGKWLRHTCSFPSWHDRLLRYGRARFKDEVWESFDTQGKIGKIKEPYIHYGFNKGINEWFKRHQRYAQWKAANIVENKKNNIYKNLFSGNHRDRSNAIEKIGSKFGVLSPFFRFFYHYILKMGFLDGNPGLIYSKMMGMYQFMIYLNILDKKNKISRK
ncbi:MAG: glycosyltransferase family 2 protein [Atribacterota bacterium]